MGIISLNSIKTYAYHGCMKEERVVGRNYVVDVSVVTDLSVSAQTDNIKDTIDYVTLCNIILEEMAIPSNLLEHVVVRILDRILGFSQIQSATVSVAKANPPINANIENVCVTITKDNKAE